MTALGTAIRAKRGEMGQAAAAAALGIQGATLSRLERGLHRPTADTALKLARWLGWTMERVMEAAGEPVPVGSETEPLKDGG